MSTTAIAWLCIFTLLALLAFRRPVWGAGNYVFSFLLCPPLWWWGKGALYGFQWSLISGCILLASVLSWQLSSQNAQPVPASTLEKWMNASIFAMALNSIVVTFGWTISIEISSAECILLLKFCVLTILLQLAIRNGKDFATFFAIVALAFGWMGVEVTLFGRGGIVHGRLEGVGAPGAREANHLASLCVTLLPVLGGYVLAGRGWVRLCCFVATPFVLNIVLLCNSRGGFLALIIAAIVMLFMARGRERRLVFAGYALAGLGLLFLLRDPKILERFSTTFASAEERDSSAQSRTEFWVRGLGVIAEHPLGLGGGVLKKVYAAKYLADLNTLQTRAVHQGYINDAACWGIQGLIARLAVYILGFACIRRGQLTFGSIGDSKNAFLGVSMAAGLTAFLVAVFFIDGLDSEWGLWLCGMSVAYLRCANLAKDQFELTSHQEAASLPADTVDTAVAGLGPWNLSPDPGHVRLPFYPQPDRTG